MDVSSFDPKIIVWALMAATLVKITVDLVKMGGSFPQWVPPALALGGGVVFVLLIMLAEGRDMSVQVVAQAAIAGVIAGGMSIGSTTLQSRTKPSTDNYVSVQAAVMPTLGNPNMTSGEHAELLSLIRERGISNAIRELRGGSSL
jgi:ABC-type Fe3+-siderophore transport system permease subunit